jgi:hypothetical protein
LHVGHLVGRPELFGFGCNRLEITDDFRTIVG